MAYQIIGGKRFTKSRAWDKKSDAKKAAKRYREAGYYARVMKQRKIIGRSKDAKGKTFKVFKRTLYWVAFRKK